MTIDLHPYTPTNLVPKHTYHEGFITRTLYPVAEKLFTAGEHVDRFVERISVQGAESQRLSIASKAYNWSLRVAGGFVKKLVDYDYKEFPKLFKWSISEPPIGALILLLFPFTIGPRLKRAAQRDSREVGDVIRRDVTAITIFLFALKPLINAMNQLKEKFWDGLKLVENTEDKFLGKVFTYSQFQKNYHIANPQTLEAIIHHGNKKGLLKAVSKLSDHGLAEAGHQELQGYLEQFKAKIDALIPAVEGQKRGDINKLSKEAFELLEKMEVLRTKPLSVLEKSASAKVLKIVETLPNFRDFFATHAKSCRLPVDILSFLIVIAGIGWFPVWFNAQWNKKQFEAQQAAKRAENAANFNPTLTYAALKSASRLNPENRFSQSV